jgi:hypothetical protein
LILSFFSLLFLIAYQPIYPILIRRIFIREIKPNDIVLQFTVVIILPWIIFDVARWVRDFIEKKCIVEDTNPTTNLNIEILELTDSQYNAMKLMYGNEITRDEALKKSKFYTSI